MNDINLFALLAGALCIAAGLMLGLLLSRRQQKLQEGRITALEEELQSLNQRLTTASQEREQLQASLNAALQQKAVAESSLTDVSQRLAHSEQQRSDAETFLLQALGLCNRFVTENRDVGIHRRIVHVNSRQVVLDRLLWR